MTEETRSPGPETIRSDFSLNDVTKEWLKSKLYAIEEITGKDVLTLYGDISPVLTSG